jgi:hypothetical protein
MPLFGIFIILFRDVVWNQNKLYVGLLWNYHL